MKTQRCVFAAAFFGAYSEKSAINVFVNTVLCDRSVTDKGHNINIKEIFEQVSTVTWKLKIK
ncbi:hypothetical protein C3B58_01315 [Lactonifactor longoviformis]|nr:hypothetical protein C3B58_01315 [Lactonifactor longoviformis]